MLINAENRFVANQWMIINWVAEYLSVPTTHVKITRLLNSELGLLITGQYRKVNSQQWEPFQPMTRIHSQQPNKKNLQS
ncbi:hypothetical protein [Endozoicomonas sp. ALD040]|uniref:hypothetical protein n=1 Tax=unclassified Endozoicomonas TaxID=2644528 RepID=UPI003BB0FC73